MGLQIAFPRRDVFGGNMPALRVREKGSACHVGHPAAMPEYTEGPVDQSEYSLGMVSTATVLRDHRQLALAALRKVLPEHPLPQLVVGLFRWLVYSLKSVNLVYSELLGYRAMWRLRER